MKSILVVIAIFLNQGIFAQTSQIDYRQINVYIIPFGNEPFIVGNQTPDYVRVHAEYKFQIFNTYTIRQILEKIDSLTNEKAYKIKRKDFNICNVVIDFVNANSIQKSIAISDNFTYITDANTTNDEVTVYKENLKLLCYLKKLFPTFIETIPIINNCK